MTKLEELKDLLAVQGRNGNWNWSPYMLGLFNGMELAISLFEDRDPVYREIDEDGFIVDKK